MMKIDGGNADSFQLTLHLLPTEEDSEGHGEEQRRLQCPQASSPLTHELRTQRRRRFGCHLISLPL